MVDEDIDENRYSALASQTRRAVLKHVIDAASAIDAATIAEATTLHVSTVRFHLDQLETAGLVRREAAHAGRRGRPQMLYRPGAHVRKSEAQSQLTRALVEVIATDPEATERALTAGHRWARSVVPSQQAKPKDSQEASARLVSVLDRLGFGPEREPDSSNEIELYACPFRDLAVDENPVVCTVHRGLVEGAAEELGHSRTDVSLTPFAQPGICVIALKGALSRSSEVAKSD